MSGQGASGSSSSATGTQPTVKREQSVGSLSSLGSLGYDTNNIMSGLQDDDLFNFVLVNADHIASGGDGTLAFMDDTSAVDAAAALPTTDAAAAVAGEGNWLPAAVADAAAAGTAAGVASFQTASTVPPMPGSVATAGVGAAAGAGVGAGAGAQKGGAVTRARGRGAGSLKRGNPGADRASAGPAASSGAVKPEKRRKRLEKNRESARECRRRKKEHLEVLEARVAKLESEAALLRERLRASRSESTKEEVEEKRQARKEMRERLAKGATDEELAGVIGAYREKFSDYGARRQTAVQYHLDQLERLLKPTQVTRMGMWCLHQDDSFYQENALDPDGGTTMWHFLCNELQVTEEQQKKIKQYRTNVRELSEGLRNTLTLLQELRAQAQVKNTALDQAMHDLQGILTPTQSAKFILWVDSNPVCMQMLNSLWSVLPK